MAAPLTVILFGATGDLAKRKLIPGLLHLFQSKLLLDMRVVGTSLDDMSVDDFRDLALAAIREHSTRTLKDEAKAMLVVEGIPAFLTEAQEVARRLGQCG